MSFIEFKDVELYFQTKTQRIKIFKDLNIGFEKGVFTVIYGPSGMGKSTLLNLVSGFVKPVSGEIFINGNSLQKMSDKEVCRYRNKSIGYIFQTFNLIPQFNVRDNVAVPLLLADHDKEYIDRAIANSPEIILADEPTGNLDRHNRENLIDMLWELCEKEGKTIICVTHDDKLMERAQRKINIEDIVDKDF